MFDNRPVEIARENRAMFPDDFLDWLPANTHVWNAFVEEAMAVIKRGFKHYSTRTIICVMRHNSAIREVGGEFKINDHHSPYFARLFDLVYPHHAGMWEYRTTKKAYTDPEIIG